MEVGQLYINNYKAKIDDALPFPISYSVADIKDPEKLKRSHTLDIDLPGSQENMELFASCFSLTISDDNTTPSIINFDPTVKSYARYEKGGLVYFDGLCKLNKIVLRNGEYKFNITLYSNVINIIKSLGSLKISDLNWSEYNHTVDIDTIENSWDTSVVVNKSWTYQNYEQQIGGSFSGYTLLTSNPVGFPGNLTTHTFATGNTITIIQNDGGDLKPAISTGTTVLATPDEYSIVIDVLFSAVGSGATMGGTVTTNSPVANFSGTPTTNFPNGLPLGFGYVYPVQELGFVRSNITRWNATDLQPMFYVREILQKIFDLDNLNLSIDSELFDTPTFRRLVIGQPKGEKFKLTPLEVQNRLFRALVDLDYTKQVPITNSQATSVLDYVRLDRYGYQGGGTSSIRLALNNEATSVTVLDDVYQQFSASTGLITVKKKGMYKIGYNGVLRSRIWWDNNAEYTPYQGFRQVKIKVYRNGSWTGEQFQLSSQGVLQAVPGTVYPETHEYWSYPNMGNPDTLITVSLEQGDTIEFKYEHRIEVTLGVEDANEPVGNLYVDMQSYGGPIGIYLESQGVELTDSDLFNISIHAPEMSCADFLRGIMKAFNLYLDDPAEGVIKFDTLEQYYGDPVDYEDWTTKVDYSKNFEIVPSSTIAGKFYNFNFKEDSDWDNQDYFSRWNERYGERVYEVPYAFADGDRNYDLPFAQSVPIKLDDSSDIILPRIIQGNPILDAIKPFKGTPRIYCYNGLEPITGTWRLTTITSADTVYGEYSAYPNINHQNSMSNPTFDWNWKLPNDLWEGATAYTTNNLWSYHGKFIQELTAKSSAIIRCYVRLTDADMYGMDFGRLKMINGVLYRLNAIKNWDNTKWQSTMVELLKVVQGDTVAVGTILEDSE